MKKKTGQTKNQKKKMEFNNFPAVWLSTGIREIPQNKILLFSAAAQVVYNVKGKFFLLLEQKKKKKKKQGFYFFLYL